MGATPARRAKELSAGQRPGCDQLISSWAAQIGPTPGSANSCGQIAPDPGRDVALVLAGLAVGRQRPPGQRTKGAHGGRQGRIVACRPAQRGAASQEGHALQGSQAGAQMVRGGDDERLELADGLAADIDRS
jgi:hypothetical protein